MCKVVITESPAPEPPVDPDTPTPTPEDHSGGGGGCNAGMTWPLFMAIVPVVFMFRKEDRRE